MLNRPQNTSEYVHKLILFLLDVVYVVKEQIRPFLPDILKAFEPYWGNNQFAILRFIRTCSTKFPSEFKLYLVYVLPRMLSLLTEDSVEKKEMTTEIIHCLYSITLSLDNHLNVVLPALLRYIENNYAFDFSLDAAIKCLNRIVNELDVSLYTCQIIMPLLRVLSCLNNDKSAKIMDIICAVVSQKQQEAYIYLPAINKVVAEKKIIHSKFTEISNALYRGGVLPPLEYNPTRTDSVMGGEEEEKKKDRNFFRRTDYTVLQNLWSQSVTLTTKDDWIDWNRRFALQLIKDSPDPAIHTCYPLAQVIPSLTNKLFNAAFTSMWNELTPHSREDLMNSFETAFKSPQVPPEIIMEVLGLAEFMEHDEDVVLQMNKKCVLPLSISLLGNIANASNAYAKALHYKEIEYETTPNTCIEQLIQINNQLHLSAAAVGVLHYSQKYHNDVTHVQGELYEKLGRWEEALEAYESKQQKESIKTELTMGRIRCLQALGESEVVLRLIRRTKDKLEESGQQQTVAISAARAAFDMGDWDLLEQYLENADPSAAGIPFYRAALLIHKDQFDQAEALITEARAVIGRTLAPIIGEGYSRVYSHIIQLEKLKELEEICALRRRYANNDPSYQRAKEHLLAIFDKRLDGVQRDVDVWHDLLSLRKLFVELGEKDSQGIPYSRDHWLRFISLARKSDRPALAIRTLSSLGINLKNTTQLGEDMNDEVGASAEVRYAYHKFLYSLGLTTNAITRLRNLVSESSYDHPSVSERFMSIYNTGDLAGETGVYVNGLPGGLSSSSLSSMAMTAAATAVPLRDLSSHVKVRMRLRLAQWELEANHKNLNDRIVSDITSIVRECAELNQEDHKAFHEIAMLHMTCTEYYIQNHSEEGDDQITSHLTEAIGSFFDAISLSPDKSSSLVLQDILRLITLWFTYGNREDVINAINRGFNIISLDTWLYVIPQLVARIHFKECKAKRLLINLLVQLSKTHPQALVYSLTRSARSAAVLRQKAAQEVLSHLRRDNPVLVKEADLVSSELIRVAVLLTEKWVRGIEEASCQYYELKNIKKVSRWMDGVYV